MCLLTTTGPKFGPQDTQGGRKERREPAPLNCLLKVTCTSWHMPQHAHALEKRNILVKEYLINSLKT